MSDDKPIPEAPSPEPAAPPPDLPAAEALPPERPPPVPAAPAKSVPVGDRKFDEKVASIKIDKDLAAFVDAQSEEELAQLKANLFTEGCRDPLVVWLEEGVLLDGHQRFELCREHRIDFEVVKVPLPNRQAAQDWMINNQTGRRNLAPERARYLRGKRYNAEKKSHGGDRRVDEASPHGENLKTAEVLAKRFNVSPATVARDGAYAEAVEELDKNSEGAKKAILSGEANLSQKEVVEAAKLPAEEQKKAIEEARKRPGKRGSKKSKGKPGKASGKASKAENGKTITLPRPPKLLAAALVKELGPQHATEVRDALTSELDKPPDEGRKQAGDEAGNGAGAARAKKPKGKPRNEPKKAGVAGVVTGAALKSKYDAYYRQVLGDALQPLPRKRKERQKYRVAKPLPSKAEYDDLKAKRFTTTVEALVDDAYGVIEGLAGEMQDAFDNTPESLQGSGVGEARQEAADNLSNLTDRPDVPEGCKDISTVFLPSLDSTSRPKQAQEAADMLSTAASAIREQIGKAGEGDDKPDTAEWEELADKLENDASELEGVDFPGMYG